MVSDIIIKKEPTENQLKYWKSKIGGIPWNKGLKGVQTAWNKGLIGYNKDYPRSKEWGENISKGKLNSEKSILASIKAGKEMSKLNIGRKHNNECKQKHRLLMLREKNPKWKEGRMINAQGYVLLLSPEHPYANKNGYVREHRLVAEKQLGRYLTPEEIIHHINGIKNDNRPENLYLFENSGKHTSFHFNHCFLISNLSIKSICLL